jgi:Fe-S oxidoreductase
MIAGIKNYGNPWMQPRRARGNWTRGLEVLGVENPDVGFFAGCSLAYLSPETARAAVAALRAAGMNPVALGSDEACCGSPLLRVGQREVFLKIAKDNIARFEDAGVRKIVAACPGCLKALREYRDLFADFDAEVVHVSEVLAAAIDEGRLELRAPKPVSVTYHDPCHLGRGCGIYDEPRRVIEAIEGVTLVEMERSREYSACCGAGGGVWTAFPELSHEIGSKRAEMARSTGADLVITSCPWCEQNLSQFIAVKDLLDLVIESAT